VTCELIGLSTNKECLLDRGVSRYARISLLWVGLLFSHIFLMLTVFNPSRIREAIPLTHPKPTFFWHGKSVLDGEPIMKTTAEYQHFSSGFTLIELIVVISIISVLAALAAPALLSTIDSARSQANLGLIIRDLNLARGEAVKSGIRVVVRKTGVNWQDGWTIFTDSDKDDTYDSSSETELLSRSNLTGSTMSGGTNFSSFIRYSPSGASNATGFFKLTSNYDSSNSVVCISTIGRIKLSQCPADSDPCELLGAC
jgi:type IV fimbrial biogenesis protein FimT